MSASGLQDETGVRSITRERFQETLGKLRNFTRDWRIFLIQLFAHVPHRSCHGKANHIPAK
jgi:hypothetical protein